MQLFSAVLKQSEGFKCKFVSHRPSRLHFPLVSFLLLGRCDWFSTSTSCRLVVISMHHCIWIWIEKAITAQFHAQQERWHISPFIGIRLSRKFTLLSVSPSLRSLFRFTLNFSFLSTQLLLCCIFSVGFLALLGITFLSRIRSDSTQLFFCGVLLDTFSCFKKEMYCFCSIIAIFI